MTDIAPTQTTLQEKGSRRMTIGLILVSVTLAAVAQVTLKAGMNHVTDANGGQLALNGDSLKQIASQVWVWAGTGVVGCGWLASVGSMGSEHVCGLVVSGHINFHQTYPHV